MTLRMKVTEFMSLRRKGTTKGKKTKPNKFGAKKTTVDGITFDSKHEAKRYRELKTLERAGIISDLSLQVVIPLIGANGEQLRGESGRKLTYRADFKYCDDGKTIIEDAKGAKNKDYLLKKSILAAQGIEIVEV